jgi:hypothetical protein
VQGDPSGRCDRIETPVLSRVDPQRLVRNPFDMTLVKVLQRLRCGRLRLELEASQVPCCHGVIKHGERVDFLPVSSHSHHRSARGMGQAPPVRVRRADRPDL